MSAPKDDSALDPMDSCDPWFQCPQLFVGSTFRGIGAVLGPGKTDDCYQQLNTSGIEYLVLAPQLTAAATEKLDANSSVFEVWKQFFPMSIVQLACEQSNRYASGVASGRIPRPVWAPRSAPWPPKYLTPQAFKPFTESEILTVFGIAYIMGVFRMPVLDFWKNDEFRRCQIVQSSISRERFKQVWACLAFSPDVSNAPTPAVQAAQNKGGEIPTATSANSSLLPLPPMAVAPPPPVPQPTPEPSTDVRSSHRAAAAALASASNPISISEDKAVTSSFGAGDSSNGSSAASDASLAYPDLGSLHHSRPFIAAAAKAVEETFEFLPSSDTTSNVSQLMQKARWSWLVIDDQRRPLFGYGLDGVYFRSTLPFTESSTLLFKATKSGGYSERIVEDLPMLWMLFIVGADIGDLRHNYTSASRRCLRDWHFHLYWVLDMCLLKTVLAFSILDNRKPVARELTLECGKMIIEFAESLDPVKSRKRKRAEESSEEARKRPRIRGTADWGDGRFLPGNHFPKHSEKQARCRVCFDLAKPEEKANCSRTSFFCAKCNVPLCVKKGKACYETWHTFVFVPSIPNTPPA